MAIEPGIRFHADRQSLSRCDSVAERFRERECCPDYEYACQADLSPALFTKTMLRDHLPSHYERATQLLCSSPLTTHELPKTATGKSVAPSYDVTLPEQA